MGGWKRCKRWLGRRKLLVATLAACGVLFGVSASFSGCMSFQMKEAEVREFFDSRGQEAPTFFRHRDALGEIFGAWSGTGERPTVVFVHGSPGSWDNFAHMLANEALTRRYTLVAVDRPGFGRSLPRGPEPSIQTQAKRTHDAVVASGAPLPAVWLGHSLGGPVVARIAIDFPESVSGLILIAPSIDPELEQRRWYNWLAKFPLIKWGLSREWRNSNEEIFPLKRELTALAEELGRIQSPTIVLHGDQDSLVPPANAEFVQRRFVSAPVELRLLEGVDHFIPWSDPEEMIRAMDALTQASAAGGTDAAAR